MVLIDGNTARLQHGGNSIEFQVLDPAVKLERRAFALPIPLGEMDHLFGEINGNEVRYEIRPH